MVYLFARLNYRKNWSRLFVVLFVTIAGGLDFLIRPELGHHEWWQRGIPMVISDIQISSFVTLYTWVPHHLIASLPLVLALMLIFDLETAAYVKATLLAILASFTLGTSAFVFISLGVAGLVGVIVGRREIDARGVMGPVLASAAVFLFLSFHQIGLSFQKSGVIKLSPFRIAILEQLFGWETLWKFVDKGITLLVLPLPATGILLVELGLPLVVFLLWVAKRRPMRSTSLQSIFLISSTEIYTFLIFFFSARGSNNVAMRGMIPVQLAFLFGSAHYLDGLSFQKPLGPGRIGRSAILAGVGLVLVVSAVTPASELFWASRETLGNVAGIGGNWVPANTNPRFIFSEQLGYIAWANKTAPCSAVFLEEEPPIADHNFRLLERVRHLDPEVVHELKKEDKELFPSERMVAGGPSNGQAADAGSVPARLADRHVYLVSRNGGAQAQNLAPSQYDDHVTVYLMHAPDGAGRQIGCPH